MTFRGITAKSPEEALGNKLRKLAETHTDGARLRDLADAFDRAADGFMAQPQTVTVKQFMGCWARARRAYCEISGEPLI